MKTYSVTISDEQEADIQYLLDNQQTIRQMMPVNLMGNTIEEVIQTSAMNQLYPMLNLVNQHKDREMLQTIKEDVVLLDEVQTKVAAIKQAKLDALPVKEEPILVTESPVVPEQIINQPVDGEMP